MTSTHQQRASASRQGRLPTASPLASPPGWLGPPGSVLLRTRAGERRDVDLAPEEHAALLTDLLHRGRPGFVELVGAHRSAAGRLEGFERSLRENFVPAGNREMFLARLRALAGSGGRVEVFFTPATLAAPLAGNDSVASAAVAWVDVDDVQRLRDLGRFPHQPHAVVASGSRGAHAYWLLAEPLPGEVAESLNRRLAAALGADLAVANRGRILRVAGSLNFKPALEGGGPRWCRLVMCDFALSRYRPRSLAAALPPDPKAEPQLRPRDDAPIGGRESWRGIEAADYYRALTGLDPGRGGRIRCPRAGHEDRHPSAQLYPGAGGWYCFACGAGGGGVDMVAALRGWPTGAALRGARYKECARELDRLFGVGSSRR